MTLIRSTRVCATLLLVMVGPSQAGESCPLVRAAQLDMQIQEQGGIYVPMTVAGHTLNLLLNTLSVYSGLTQSTVSSLGIATHRTGGTKFVMFGGTIIDRYLTVPDVEFGRLKADHLDFLVMPDAAFAPPVSGYLGSDIMNAYDNEFDFANAKFNLFAPDHCTMNLAYWTHDPHAEIPFTVNKSGQIEFEVTLDGIKITALLSTAPSRSFLDLDRAEYLFGFSESDPSLKVIGDTPSGHSYRYPFKSLTFGDETSGLGSVKVLNPDLILMSEDDAKFPGPKSLILRLDVLRQLHIYIAHKEKKLYVTAASAH